MRKAIFLATVLFALIGCAPSAQSSKNVGAKVLVSYMPTFVRMPWETYASKWAMKTCDPTKTLANGRLNICTRYYPEIGMFHNDEQRTIEYDTLLIKMSGADGVIIDWGGIHDVWDARQIMRTTEMLANEFDRAGLEYSIMWEDRVLAAAVEQGKVSSIEVGAQETLEYLQKNWFNRKGYTKINGKPLLTIWGPYELGKIQNFKTLKARYGDPFVYTNYGWQDTKFDGGYSWVNNRGVSNSEYFKDYLSNYEHFKWPFKMVSATPGFEDWYKEGGWEETHPIIRPNNGETLRRGLVDALATDPAVIQVPTWNDWIEASAIMPSAQDQYGYRYIKILQEFTGSMFQGIDLSIAKKMYELYDTEDAEKFKDIRRAVYNNDPQTAKILLGNQK